MKQLVLSVLAIALSAAHADLLPSQLPDGKYDVACTYVSQRSGDGLKFSRDSSTSTGSLVVISYDNVYTERQSTVTVNDGEGSKFNDESITETTVKQLANGYFLSTVESKWSTDYSSSKGYTGQFSDKATYTLVTRVKDGFEIGLKRTKDNGPVLDSVSESHTVTHSDGTIEVISYLREPFKVPSEVNESGDQVGGVQMNVSNSVCRYKLAK